MLFLIINHLPGSYTYFFQFSGRSERTAAPAFHISEFAHAFQFNIQLNLVIRGAVGFKNDRSLCTFDYAFIQSSKTGSTA